MPRTFASLLLALLCGLSVVYLAGNASVQLWDRDEPRYAQTARQMLESGDWVVPRFLDTVRTAKPVLIYWCQAAAMGVVGDTAFGARLPSVLAMISAVALLALAIRRERDGATAVWTAFIFGTTGLAIASAKMSITDAVLLLFIMIAQLCVYRLWRDGARPWTTVGLGLAIALAGLTKGPVVLGVIGMTLLALWLLRPRGRRVEDAGVERAGVEGAGVEPPGFDAQQFPIIAGVVMASVFAVVFPWLYAISVHAPGFLTQSIGHDVIQRARSGHEGHTGPPGFYLLLVWGTFFPWSLLIPAALVNAWRRRGDPTIRFALAALIGPWLMFELVAGKLPHYILPTYPALAYLVADLLLRASRGEVGDLGTRVARVGAVAWGAIVVALGLAGFGLLAVAGQWDAASVAASSGMAIVAIAIGCVVVREFWRARVLRAGLAMGVGSIVLVSLFYGMLLPRYQPLRLSQRLADLMTAHGGAHAPGLMIDYKEPSLAFHAGGGLREEASSRYLLETPPSKWPAWLVITERVWQTMPPAVRERWREVGRETGWALNMGDIEGVERLSDKFHVTVLVLRRADPG